MNEAKSQGGSSQAPQIIIAGLAVVVFVCAFLLQEAIANLAICTGALVVGVLLSFVLFLQGDDDMRGLKTLLLGAISGTGLAKSDAIITRIGARYGNLVSPNDGDRYLGRLFFLGLAAGLLGFVGGFLVLRVGGLEGAIADEQRKIKNSLKGVPEIPQVPLPELDEFWPQLKAPTDKVVEELAKIEDWSGISASDAIRAAAVFFSKQRWADVIRVLEPQVTTAESPSPMAFDLYAGALVMKGEQKTFAGEDARHVDRMCSRMLTYWPDSFLVNLDVGFLYLYLANRAKFAVFYARRALAVRPDSGAANLNLACALAQQIGSRLATDDEVGAITAALDNYLSVSSDAAAKVNKEGDFDALKSNAKFATWLKDNGVT